MHGAPSTAAIASGGSSPSVLWARRSGSVWPPAATPAPKAPRAHYSVVVQDWHVRPSTAKRPSTAQQAQVQQDSTSDLAHMPKTCSKTHSQARAPRKSAWAVQVFEVCEKTVA